MIGFQIIYLMIFSLSYYGVKRDKVWGSAILISLSSFGIIFGILGLSMGGTVTFNLIRPLFFDFLGIFLAYREIKSLRSREQLIQQSQ